MREGKEKNLIKATARGRGWARLKRSEDGRRAAIIPSRGNTCNCWRTGGSLNRHAQGLGRRLYHLLFGGALPVGLLLAHVSRMFQE
jgi:hypothetical protein